MKVQPRQGDNEVGISVCSLRTDDDPSNKIEDMTKAIAREMLQVSPEGQKSSPAESVSM